MIIDGKVVNDLEPKDRDIAMVFQSYALYPHLTVRDNIAFALKLRKMPKDEINRRVEDAAKTLELTAVPRPSPGASSPVVSGSEWRWAGRSSVSRRRS